MEKTTHAGPVFDAYHARFQMFLAHYVVGPYYYIFRRLHVSGRENVPHDRPLIVVSNHISNFDPPIACIAADRNMCFVAKKELFENPYLTWLITLLGAIYIDRQKPSHSSFKQVKKAIKAGWCVSIFVEGTRSKVPGSLGPPHTGAAYLALSNKLAILPVGLIDTNTKKGKCYARIGKIIEPSSDLEATTWEIMRSLSELTGYQLPADGMPAGF